MSGIYSNGKRIAELRKAIGLTQEALAAMAQCDVKTIWRAENDGRISSSTLRRIGEVLDADFHELALDPGRSADERAHEASVWTFFQAYNDRNVSALTELFHGDAKVTTYFFGLHPAEEVRSGKVDIERKWEREFADTNTDELSVNNIRVDAVRKYVFARGMGIQARRVSSDRKIQLSFMREFQFKQGKIHSLTSFCVCDDSNGE